MSQQTQQETSTVNVAELVQAAQTSQKTLAVLAESIVSIEEHEKRIRDLNSQIRTASQPFTDKAKAETADLRTQLKQVQTAISAAEKPFREEASQATESLRADVQGERLQLKAERAALYKAARVQATATQPKA